MKNVIEVLKECKVEGNIVRLPNEQLDRKLYLEVAKKLNLIGGKWKGHKIMGFVFPFDPTDLLKQIANGENRNLKKEYQFFETPQDLADRLVQLANINENDDILEPSAGQGAIVKAINRKLPKKNVYCYELMNINRLFLNDIPTVILNAEPDFLKYSISFKCDKIIANPPFRNNQDIDHIIKMYNSLKSGGRLVSIASKHWQISNNKKETAFKGWLNEVKAVIKNVPENSFKESGTKIDVVIIIIDKE